MKIFIVMGIGILIGRFLMIGKLKKWNERLAMLSVSYTHLTLPTILRV